MVILVTMMIIVIMNNSISLLTQLSTNIVVILVTMMIIVIMNNSISLLTQLSTWKSFPYLDDFFNNLSLKSLILFFFNNPYVDDGEYGDNDDASYDHEEFNFSINSTSSLGAWKTFSLPKIHIFNNFYQCFSPYVPQLFKYSNIL